LKFADQTKWSRDGGNHAADRLLATVPVTERDATAEFRGVSWLAEIREREARRRRACKNPCMI